MKALRASAGTSQPVLSSQQVQTVFYQVPELRDMHQSFYSGLKARLSVHSQTDPSPGENREMGDASFELTVGDLFLKMVIPLMFWYLKADFVVLFSCTTCFSIFMFYQMQTWQLFSPMKVPQWRIQFLIFLNSTYKNDPDDPP